MLDPTINDPCAMQLKRSQIVLGSKSLEVVISDLSHCQIQGLKVEEQWQHIYVRIIKPERYAHRVKICKTIECTQESWA